MTVTKTFTPITDAPGKVVVGKCSEILENHMQCWRASDVIITVVTHDLVTGVETVISYQKCRRHAEVEKHLYDLDIQADQAQAQAETQAEAALKADAAKPIADQAAVKKGLA